MTLAQAIQSERVPMDELHDRYEPLLNMVDGLIGVVPNCDTYLEVWPPGFRTYNLMVPNFLNLPASLLGRSLSLDIVGLAMYASSRAAGCHYCSAHTCSLALRQGASAHAVTGEARTHSEQAVVDIANALSTDPHGYTPDLALTLRQHYLDADAEWIVMGIAMMGFLNKFMDAMGVELEREAVRDVSALLSPTGWEVGQHDWADSRLSAARGTIPTADTGLDVLRMLRSAPGALRLERKWMNGLPKDGSVARAHIRDRYGYDEELLSHLMHAKPRRALAAMLRHNLDPRQSETGIGYKALASLVYANHVGNPWLAQKSKRLAAEHGIVPQVVATAENVIDLTDKALPINARTAAVVAAALAMSPSPATVDATTIETVVANLSPTEIVEIAVWLSVSQLQHRLSLWYGLHA